MKVKVGGDQRIKRWRRALLSCTAM